MQLPVPRAPMRPRRRGMSGLADDASGFSFDMMTPAAADAARQDVPANVGSPDYSYPAADDGSLSSSPINWNNYLPSLIGAGVDIFKTQTAGDVARAQAGYGIAPPGYTYRGAAYNVQSSYGSSMPMGYSPTYTQPPSVGIAQAQQQGMSSTMVLLLLGGAAFFLLRDHEGKK